MGADRGREACKAAAVSCLPGVSAFKIRPLSLEAYPKPKCLSSWYLPVCAASLRDRLFRLNPNNLTNWEEVDIDGCPTMCYRLTGKQIRAWNSLPFHAVWPQLSDRLGSGPAKAFFGDMWLRFHNGKARARNRWEEKHGGIRADRFDRGPSIREAARMSIA